MSNIGDTQRMMAELERLEEERNRRSAPVMEMDSVLTVSTAPVTSTPVGSKRNSSSASQYAASASYHSSTFQPPQQQCFSDSIRDPHSRQQQHQSQYEDDQLGYDASGDYGSSVDTGASAGDGVFSSLDEPDGMLSAQFPSVHAPAPPSSGDGPIVVVLPFSPKHSMPLPSTDRWGDDSLSRPHSPARPGSRSRAHSRSPSPAHKIAYAQSAHELGGAGSISGWSSSQQQQQHRLQYEQARQQKLRMQRQNTWRPSRRHRHSREAHASLGSSMATRSGGGGGSLEHLLPRHGHTQSMSALPSAKKVLEHSVGREAVTLAHNSFSPPRSLTDTSADGSPKRGTAARYQRRRRRGAGGQDTSSATGKNAAERTEMRQTLSSNFSYPSMPIEAASDEFARARLRQERLMRPVFPTHIGLQHLMAGIGEAGCADHSGAATPSSPGRAGVDQTASAASAPRLVTLPDGSTLIQMPRRQSVRLQNPEVPETEQIRRNLASLLDVPADGAFNSAWRHAEAQSLAAKRRQYSTLDDRLENDA